MKINCLLIVLACNFLFVFHTTRSADSLRSIPVNVGGDVSLKAHSSVFAQLGVMITATATATTGVLLIKEGIKHRVLQPTTPRADLERGTSTPHVEQALMDETTDLKLITPKKSRCSKSTQLICYGFSFVAASGASLLASYYYWLQ